jgi:methyltransferase
MNVFGWLAVMLGAIIAQRLAELAISARHARRVLAYGGREYGAGHFPFIVLVHVLFPLMLATEVIALGARPPAMWPLWLVVWLAAQALRYSAIHALGDRWNVRIIVLPGTPRVSSGPYRFFSHPNYVAVVTELIAAPLLFGAWRTAIVITVLNAFALAARIRAENAALDAADRA